MIAFTRSGSQARAPGLAVVVPRLVAKLGGQARALGGTWGSGAWGDTAVALPEGGWTDVLSGERVEGGSVGVEALLRRFPVAVLGREA